MQFEILHPFSKSKMF